MTPHLSSLALVIVIALPSLASAGGQRLLYNLVGTGEAYESTVPDIDGDGEDDPATCFDVAVRDLARDQVIGTATDCLSEITPVGDGLALIGTSIFNTPQGRIITRGATTVQPTTHGSPGFTHITGALPSGGNDVIGGTHRFRNATGSVRLSGAADLSQLGSDGLIFFDCLFVIDLD